MQRSTFLFRYVSLYPHSVPINTPMFSDFMRYRKERFFPVHLIVVFGDGLVYIYLYTHIHMLDTHQSKSTRYTLHSNHLNFFKKVITCVDAY